MWSRHAKILLDQGFQVKAIDLIEQNIIDTKNCLKDYDKTKYQLECIDFNEINDGIQYDVAIAWNFLYGYNESLYDCCERVKKINTLLKHGGKIILSLKVTDDIFNTMFEKNEKGLIDNTLYHTPGCIFHTRKDVIDLMNVCKFDIDYIERFSRSHNMNWKNVKGNSEWGKTNLDLYEDWWAICATKI